MRDPVERVISNFYYRRAGWNIVERKLAFPDEPLPDPAFLRWPFQFFSGYTLCTKLRKIALCEHNFTRRDFESCVLEGDPECSYVEGGTDTAWETGDHRRQLMQFCGQHSVCAKFNSKDALERAKANVAAHYTVVGVTEMWDESLQVMEELLPFFFKGAKQMYQKKQKEVKRPLFFYFFNIKINLSLFRCGECHKTFTKAGCRKKLKIWSGKTSQEKLNSTSFARNV